MIGRRKDGVTLAQVQARLEPIYRRTVDHLLASVPGPIPDPCGTTFSASSSVCNRPLPVALPPFAATSTGRCAS